MSIGSRSFAERNLLSLNSWLEEVRQSVVGVPVLGIPIVRLRGNLAPMQRQQCGLQAI
jgi:hypothetical protein